MTAIGLAVAATVGVFTGLSAFLLIAERLLVNYGPCVINVNEGEHVFEIQGGSALLGLLQENGVSIPSACGGKGSCGYCRVKVLRGGGPVLPTEAPYLTRTEIRSGVRLACQVKVKADIDIRIPDFLETVRSMVENRTYDPTLQWRWLVPPQMAEEPLRFLDTDLTEQQRGVVTDVLARHGETKGSIVPVLQEINTALKYLPEPVFTHLSEALGKPVSEIHRIATFYNAFSLVPRGENVIKVCLGTACYVKRGEKILETIERKLGIKVGQCTEDGKFSIETVSCIGCCGQSPSMVINEEIYGYLRPESIDGILAHFS